MNTNGANATCHYLPLVIEIGETKSSESYEQRWEIECQVAMLLQRVEQLEAELHARLGCRLRRIAVV